MKHKLPVALTLGAFACVLFYAGTTSDNGRAGYTGSPGETKCNTCHNQFPLESGGGSAMLVSNMTNWEYQPGQTYQMSLVVSRTGNPLFGMDLEALDSTNDNAGTLVITNTKTQIKTKTVNGIVRNNVVHTLNGGATASLMAFTFDWTAPATSIGPVTMYYTGVAADNDGGTDGDYVYSGTQLITPQVATSVQDAAGPAPWSVFPVPASEWLGIRGTVDGAGTLSARLFDVRGRLTVMLLDEDADAGPFERRVSLHGQGIGPGAYVLEVIAGTDRMLHKVVIE